MAITGAIEPIKGIHNNTNAMIPNTIDATAIYTLPAMHSPL
jgi:hypothetical protein